MVRRWLVILALAGSVAAVLLWSRRPQVERAPASTASAVRKPAPAPVETPRLRPDARFLLAVADVHSIVRGLPRPEATAEFQNGAWRIACGGEAVGSLPEIPDFHDLRTLLTGWAVRLGARDSVLAPAVPGSYSDVERALRRLEALRAADLVDRRWKSGVRDPELLRLAARAHALLAAETVDDVGAADRVGARALALVAIGCALDSTALSREECLTAATLGYAAEAAERSGELPVDDPVRSFALHEDRRLETWPRKDPRRSEARLYAMLRCGARRDLEGWTALLRDELPRDSTLALPVLATGLRLGRFESNRSAAALVITVVVVDLKLHRFMTGAAAENVRTGEALAAEFEDLMGGMPAEADGPLLDREMLRGYYRGFFYTSLFNIGDHLRTQLSSVEATAEFAEDLGDGGDRTGPDAEFERWFSHLADAKRGHGDNVRLRADVAGMPHFGARLAFQSYEAIRAATPYGEPFLRRSAMELGTRLDTRPSSLVEYGQIVHRDLLDLPRSERLLARGIEASHPQDLALRSWWASFNGDLPGLQRMLATPGLPPEQRAAALRNLGLVAGVDTLTLMDAYRSCLAERPDDWELARSYVLRLEGWRNWRESERVCRAWLARPNRSDRAFDEIGARTSLARALKQQGRFEEGLAAITPVVDSWQGGALAQAVDLLWFTGRVTEAETLAVAAWQRYPDNPYSFAHVVGTFWRAREYALAATTLRSTRRAPSPDDWRWNLGPYFVSSFARDTAAGSLALDALEAAGLSSGENIGLLASALADSGFHGRAFDVRARVRDRGQGGLQNLVQSYKDLRATRGRDEAVTWIRSRAGTDAQSVSLLTYFGFMMDCDELLWSLDFPPMTESETDFLWLLRAAAYVRGGASGAGQRSELDRHFAERGDGHYRILGRYLLGLESEDAVLATGIAPDSKCENAFYLGLRAESEGDYARAAGWYLACVRTEQRREGEYSWSFQRLASWSNRWNSLERIARADGRTPKADASVANATN